MVVWDPTRYLQFADVRARPFLDLIAQIPTGRLGSPEEIAYAVAFFVPDEAGWITGANLAANSRASRSLASCLSDA